VKAVRVERRVVTDDCSRTAIDVFVRAIRPISRITPVPRPGEPCRDECLNGQTPNVLRFLTQRSPRLPPRTPIAESSVLGRSAVDERGNKVFCALRRRLPARGRDTSNADEVAATRLHLTVSEFNEVAQRFFDTQGLRLAMRRMTAPWPPS
jgi:hypothetical protein